jgi:hypothetical protein
LTLERVTISTFALTVRPIALMRSNSLSDSIDGMTDETIADYAPPANNTGDGG